MVEFLYSKVCSSIVFFLINSKFNVSGCPIGINYPWKFLVALKTTFFLLSFLFTSSLCKCVFFVILCLCICIYVFFVRAFVFVCEGNQRMHVLFVSCLLVRMCVCVWTRTYIYIYIYIYVYIQGALDKLSSKLKKKEINSNISFYHIYLQTFHEIISKYYRSNKLIEITMSFNYSLQSTVDSPLIRLVNAAIILAFSSSLVLHRVFSTSLDSAPRLIIKGNTIWNNDDQTFLVMRSKKFPQCQHWVFRYMWHGGEYPSQIKQPNYRSR